jgi:ribosome-associated toxin RatA of RatAB toxin-antitoxin module
MVSDNYLDPTVETSFLDGALDTDSEGGEDSGIDFLDADVEIRTEKLPGRQRRIIASTHIASTPEQVWQVLTDYDNLAEFIPNLAQSQRINHPQEGIRLEQIGTQCFLNVKFCARVVLDMVEAFPRELQFSMVEGDFRQFEGKWSLDPVSLGQTQNTRLCYDLLVCPPRAMPAGLIERHIRRGLSQNLTAIRDRVILLFGSA